MAYWEGTASQNNWITSILSNGTNISTTEYFPGDDTEEEIWPHSYAHIHEGDGSSVTYSIKYNTSSGGTAKIKSLTASPLNKS